MWFSFVWIQLAVVLAVAMPSNIAETRESEGFAQRILGSWKSTDGSKVSVKTFHADGTYTEIARLMVARATITGLYRLEGQQLWWVAQKLTMDRREGDVFPPTRHVRLNKEQKATIEWRNGDMFVIRSERAIVYRRVLP